MNKAQVTKHKEVIKFFLEYPEKGVWTRGTSFNWSHTLNPEWGLKQPYVQNDSYHELRMAQVDGKIIESYYMMSEWKAFEDSDFCGELHWYRIKSDEPAFKVGHWLTSTHTNDFSKTLVTEMNILGVNDGNSYELWEPQEGEWCVFYDDPDTYVVAKFGATAKGFHYPVKGGMYHNIAPLEFIATLKG